MGLTLIFKDKPRLRGGSGARGVIVPSENGEPGIFVPSFGIMEQEEIDYVVGMAKEKRYKRITQPKRITIETTRDSHEVDIREV